MKHSEIVWDIITILTKSNITNDERFGEAIISSKINNYRAQKIIRDWNANKHINPVYLQDFGVDNVNSADDPAISHTSLCFGKVTLPPVVTFYDSSLFDKGVWRVASSSKQKRYAPVTMDKLMLMIALNDWTLNHYHYYLRIGNALYLYPYVNQVNYVLVCENPFDGYVFRTEKIYSGELINGENYTVESGSIIYNGTNYSFGATFTANAVGIFTGTGVVKFTTKKRRLTWDDEYPVSREIAQEIIIDILTKDYNIERQQVADITNDAMDEMKVMGLQNHK
jgi:hypothetical protein